MAQYIVIINNDERISNDEEDTLSDVEYEVGELLRSGHFEVESVEEVAE